MNLVIKQKDVVIKKCVIKVCSRNLRDLLIRCFMHYTPTENASHLGTYNISGPVVDVYRVVTPGGATVRFSVTYEVCYPGTESLLTSGPGE